MVLYNRITIIFYAIVDNQSADICIPTDIAISLFTKYGLDKVSIESLGLYDNYDSLCNGLYNIFRDVAKSKITEEEEGSVLYFVKRGGDKDEVLSMCKLKTIEYRLFRKMREKLRSFYKDGKGPKRSLASLVQAFKSESKVLAEGNDLPMPFEFYVDLFQTAFKFIEDHPEQLEVLQKTYVTFQEDLLKYYAV
jgi:hypothetical protein